MPWLSRYTYSLQYQMCSIEFLIIFNYPAITIIFAINQITRYNEDSAITNIFFGTVALCWSGVPLYQTYPPEIELYFYAKIVFCFGNLYGRLLQSENVLKRT